MKICRINMIERLSDGLGQRAVPCHLIRHPAHVICSYTAKGEKPPEFNDIGYGQQTALFDKLAEW